MRQKLNWFFPKISRLVLVAVIALTGVGYAAMIPFGFWKKNCLYLTSQNHIFNGSVTSVATDGVVTYVGGWFTTVDGFPRKGLAALDAVTGALLPFDPKVNGGVNSMVISGTKLYIAGSFSALDNFVVTNGAPFHTADDQPIASFPSVDGSVRVSIPDGAGGWYIAGYFTHVGGLVRNNLARINSNGTVHPWDPGTDGEVVTLVLSGTTLYVGGYFATIGGQSRNNIAALDTTIDTNNATAWDPGGG